MLTTDCGFLENELMDVVRLFKSRPQSVTHAFRFDGGVFYNDFVVDGKAYSFKDEGQGCDEIEFKRLERRFGKLGLYAVLSELYKEDMPWGALTGNASLAMKMFDTCNPAILKVLDGAVQMMASCKYFSPSEPNGVYQPRTYSRRQHQYHCLDANAEQKRLRTQSNGF